MQEGMARALRTGFIHYDRGKGWSGPIATIGGEDKWQRRLASSFMGIDYEDWRVAAVLSKTASEARLGFADGSSGRLPASAAQMGYRKRGTSAFVAMKPGALIGEIGRAHVCTPVNNANLVCRCLFEKTIFNKHIHSYNTIQI